jgi:phosphatidylserine decarboxylase
MATITTPTKPLTAAPIASAQPGGGLCMSLELFWGRWRRAWLRRLRPGYVTRMAQLRQGDCPNCPHDIIDSRDLKYNRNVCGYRFAPADDAFAWRGRLRLARYGLAELFCFSVLFAAVASLFGGLAALHPLFLLPLPLVFGLWIFIISFFRDPERVIPSDQAVLVSPADGTVTHVQEVADPDFPGGRALCVSIFLSVFNVHVNRVPRTGKVVKLHYYPGEFLDARVSDCGVRNEQFWVDLLDERTGCLVRTKQIAGAIARRIVCWLKQDEMVRAGDRYGMIKFGSRTELVLPVDMVAETLVKVGDPVKGGSTVLLRMKQTAGSIE